MSDKVLFRKYACDLRIPVKSYFCRYMFTQEIILLTLPLISALLIRVEADFRINSIQYSKKLN